MRFFLGVTLDRADAVAKMSSVREPRKLPVVLSREEVARLIDAAGKPKYLAALSVAYGAGLRASEVIALKVGDIEQRPFWRSNAASRCLDMELGMIGSLSS